MIISCQKKVKHFGVKIGIRFKNVEFDALPVYDARYVKSRIRTYGRKVYTNLRGLNVPLNGVEYEYFITIAIDFLLVYNNKYYIKVHLKNYAYKIVNTEMMDYLDDNHFESAENQFFDKLLLQMLHYDRIDISKGTDVVKSNKSKDCIICYHLFFNHVFGFPDSVCNSCCNLSILCLNLSDIAIITAKNFDYYLYYSLYQQI